MRVKVNGEDRELPEGLSVRALIEHVGLGAGPVAVEKNGVVVPRKEHAATMVDEGDAIEIVHFVGGG